MNQVKEHLRLLAIFHYIVGGIGFLVSLFPVIHLVAGLALLLMPNPKVPEITASSFPPQAESGEIEVERGTAEAPPSPPPHSQPFGGEEKVVGIAFVVFSSVFILIGFTLSALIIRSGRCLASHRSHTFCIVIAGFLCIFMPLGTVLGVFTIITLLKPEARELFGLPSLDGPGIDGQSLPGS